MLINITDLKFHKSVHGIIHIGAHECEERYQYLVKFHNITDDEIIWIDALKDKVDYIKSSYPSIKIFNECISDMDDECVTFKVTNNYQSSSILNLKEHLIEHPDIYEINKIEMKTKTLKTFYKENNFAYNQFNFMALDIQGAELLALKGAQEILDHVDYLYLEVNTKEIYENCALLEDVEKYLEKFGFKRQNILMTGHGWGDAFYAKNIFTIENNFRIEYGTDIIKIDVTEKVLQNEDAFIKIPLGDENRGKIFGDPTYGILKQVYIVDGEDIYTIQDMDTACIDLKNSKLYINQKLSYLSIMAIFKNETMNLKLWLDHYLWQGAEHFYLIDNGSTDNPLEILQDYIDQGVVTYYFKPEKYCQVEHYRHVYDVENIKEKTYWLCICDLDEFFFGTEKKLTSTLLESFYNFDVVYTNSYFYGSDNLTEHPKDIRTSIIHRQDDLENGIKYIFRPCAINNISEMWIHWLVNSGTTCKKVMETETFDNKKIRLNHYNIQSLEYFTKAKMTRGDVNISQNEYARNMDYFENYQQLSIVKDDTLKQLIENNTYELNGESMKFYDENNTLIDNNVIEKCEQDLANQYILEDDVVLELGARYGSVSCAINKKLKNKLNQISVEPDKSVWNALEFNKIKNNCNFHITNGFISNKKLDLELSGYAATFVENEKTQIKSYTLEEIRKQYNIPKFTALVADCEGFLEIFFDENPELYDELRIIIFEADCQEKCNYEKIKQELFKKNFVKIVEGHQNVWMKNDDFIVNEKCKVFVYGDSHAEFNFKNFGLEEQISFYDRHEYSITMFRIGRDEKIINFDSSEHDENSILCFNYGEIDSRCHIQKQINLGRNKNEIIYNLVGKYFEAIKKNIKYYKKIVIIAATPQTLIFDFEKVNGPITHKHPFVGNDKDRIEYTFTLNNAMQEYCLLNNFYYFDPFDYYKRFDGSLNRDFSDRYVHIENNKHFLKKFYSDILSNKEEASSEINNDESIVENLTLCNYLKNNMPRDKYNYFLKSFPTESFSEEDNFLYKFENVINYEYTMFVPEVKISKINKPLLTNPTLYFIFDCNGIDGFGHWIYETFVWFPFLEKLNTLYKDVKILTSNKKKYVKKFINFFGLTNEIVYEIENKNNLCFIPPVISLNAQADTPIFVRLIENFIKKIEETIIDFNISNKILFLPRNLKDNYWPTDKIDVKFLFERRIQSDVDIISEGVIKNGGIVLNSYEINNFFLQFSIIKSSRNIIVEYGSSHFVNCIFCKNKNIVILNKLNLKHHHEFPTSLTQIHNIIQKNNNVTIIDEYNCYEDIEKHLMY